MKTVSELRQDIISGDWVVIATGRAKRPHEFLKQKRPRFNQPKKTCPFEKLHKDALLVYSLDGEFACRNLGEPSTPLRVWHPLTLASRDGRHSSSPPPKSVGGSTGSRPWLPGWEDEGGREKNNWWVEAVPNKYPAFGKGACSLFHEVGPYQWIEGVGFHEVVVTRSHERSIAQMSREEVELILRIYQERYLAISKDECVRYIAILHNHGRLSGATISHPHSQIIAIPVTPPDIRKSIHGSGDYSNKHQTCIHCLVLRYELKAKERVIYENKSFVVIAPYASKTAFEIRIFPKKHSPHFEEIGTEERGYLADVLRVSLAKLFKGLKNPDYNFFLHTAPTHDAREFDQYHWHLEILPKTAIWGGFEISTGIEISTITPEGAAEFLRSIKT